jgi:galacturan 1,4-alpha-galacturonidase
MGEQVLQPGSYESCCEPRGGGWGYVRNLTFANIDVTNAQRGVYIGQDNGNGGNASNSGTSKIEISDIHFTNFTGILDNTANTASISCSKVYPCYDVYFANMTLQGSGGSALKGSCKYAKSEGIHGLSGC